MEDAAQADGRWRSDQHRVLHQVLQRIVGEIVLALAVGRDEVLKHAFAHHATIYVVEREAAANTVRHGAKPHTHTATQPHTRTHTHTATTTATATATANVQLHSGVTFMGHSLLHREWLQLSQRAGPATSTTSWSGCSRHTTGSTAWTHTSGSRAAAHAPTAGACRALLGVTACVLGSGAVGAATATTPSRRQPPSSIDTAADTACTCTTRDAGTATITGGGVVVVDTCATVPALGGHAGSSHSLGHQRRRGNRLRRRLLVVACLEHRHRRV